MIDVIGTGVDGYPGLPAGLAHLVDAAEVVIGAERLLATLPQPAGDQARRGWPSPLLAGLPDLLTELKGRSVVVLASGDPLVSGIASTLIRHLGRKAAAERLRVHPAVSSVALARARLGWPAETHETISLVSAPVEELHRWLTPQARLILLSAGPSTPGQVAAALCAAGWPDAELTVLGRLGTDAETRQQVSAERFATEIDEADVAGLNIVAVELGQPHPVTESGSFGLGVTPGLPDELFEHDGQLTKWEVRIAALARLRPVPGQLLWDLGAGAGSVAIEWARTHPTCRAIAVERDETRAQRIGRNAAALGVPRTVQVRLGGSADLLADLPAPDAVFIGGGATPALIDQAWARLGVGGRFVAHAVTVESERLLLDAQARLGGTLRRLSIDRVEPLGTLHSWTPARPVVQWAAVKLTEGNSIEEDRHA